MATDQYFDVDQWLMAGEPSTVSRTAPDFPQPRGIDLVNNYFRSKLSRFGERLGHDYTEARSVVGQWLRENLPGLIEGMAMGTGPTGPMLGALSKGNAAYEAVARNVRRMVEERKAAGTYGRAPDVVPTATEREMPSQEQIDQLEAVIAGRDRSLAPSGGQLDPRGLNLRVLDRARLDASSTTDATYRPTALDIRSQYRQFGLLPEAWSPVWGRGHPGWAPAEFVGMQEMPGGAPFALYNLTADIPGHPAGSTVSRHTLESFGFELPPLSQEIAAKTRRSAPLPDARTWDELSTAERNDILGNIWNRGR